MTTYSVAYTMTADMQSRAMLSWAKPTYSVAQKRKRWAAGAGLSIAATCALVWLLGQNLITAGMLASAGAGFYAALLFWLFINKRNTRMLMGFANEALARQGQTKASFSPENVAFQNDLASSQMAWRSFDDVMAMPDATVLRAGALIYPVPDAALPEGTNPQAFRSDLTRWMEAAK
ncbi:MAG: hypothetical protein ABJR02_00165 [Marinomonas sp.]|uniref:hypothetical protein n=1 Tax=Parasphingorhabdus sp. TaxID=2709688 RepID=UPI003296DD51